MTRIIQLAGRERTRPASLTERSDDELMLLVRTGMSDALTALVERHVGKLSQFCAKLVGDRRAADEIVQETWLRVWTYRKTYRPEGKFAMLLYTTARNLCRNHARAGRRKEHWLPAAAEAGVDAVADDREDHLDALLARERQRDMQRALSALPELMREALLLRFQEELSYEDIAAIVGAPESTVRSRVHHGLKQLRRHLGEGGSR